MRAPEKISYGLISKRAGLLALFFCLLAGNTFAMGSRPKSPPKDTTLPQISISSPENNATVSATVAINASASDNIGITKVDFSVDSALKLTDTASPYNYSWDTTAVTNGAHTIKVTAYDAANNTKQAQVSVKVDNPVAPPPPPPSEPELSITSVSASGSNSAHPPQAAIDKNSSTYWQGN